MLFRSKISLDVFVSVCDNTLQAVPCGFPSRLRARSLTYWILARNVADRYLEGMDEEHLEELNFSDACKAFAFASQLGKFARETDAPDQSLLDQACGENLAPKTPVPPNNPDPAKP